MHIFSKLISTYFPLPPYSLSFVHVLLPHLGLAVAQLVEALRYKPEGRGFDS